MNRGYICDACEYQFEILQPLHEEKLKECPRCKAPALYQDLRGQYHSVVKEASTLGQLGERNAKKLGKYGLEEKQEANRIKKLKDKQEKLQKQGIDRPLEKCEHKPWYGQLDSESVSAINKMTPEQKIKYIHEGE